MKKAKFMLVAIAVFAIAGGAAAFKAKHQTTTIFTHDPQDLPTVCTVAVETFTTSPNVDFSISATYDSQLPCSTLYTTAVEPI